MKRNSLNDLEAAMLKKRLKVVNGGVIPGHRGGVKVGH
jgi:hypothetical protein